MDNLQLTELAKQAQSGDMQAFEKLYIELSPEIYSIAYEITQNKEESRDLMQDCFVSAMENINSLKEPEKIKNWLIRIAANKSHDYIKKKKPSIFTEEQYCMIENLEEVGSEVIPEKSLDAQERAEEVNEMLQSLSEDKRLCLLLRYKHNMSYAEIAQELGITESAVKSRISRAKDDIEKEAEKRKKKGLPLFGVAPFGLVIFALKKSADITAASFASSAAQTAAFAGISAASQAGIAASSAAVTATTAASTATASTAATTGTGIAAKVAALSVAQKVIAGVSVAAVVTGSGVGVATVVKSNSEKDLTTTAFVEEVTTAPSFEEDFILPIIAGTSETAENSSYAETDSSSAVATNKATSNHTSTFVSKAESQAATNGTTAKNSATTTKKPTTTKAQTTTKKQTTTKSATTTKASTTAKSTTTTKSQTTAKAATTTTTKAATTTTATAVTATTTKAATTTTTTEASSPATVTVTVWGETSSTTKTLYFEAGETITATEIENRLSDEYGIEAIADDINITAEAGGSYTATAYE